MSEAMKVRTVRVQHDDWKAALAKAGEERRSVSEVVRYALALYADGSLTLPPTR